MTSHRSVFAAWLLCGLSIGGTPGALAMTSPADASKAPLAATGQMQFAQAVPSPALPTQPAVPKPRQPSPVAAAADPAADDEPIGNVVTLTGTATLTRNKASNPLKLKDDIFKNDVLKTSANSTLGVTFNDATTFNLTANAQITIDNFVYEDGGKANAALFNISLGTVAFVASAVAKTGDMKIATPTATLGIRGTSGLVEVPASAAAAGTNNVNIKLYPDPDGRVGRIEVNGRDGARLGFLTQAASGFAIHPGAGGRFAAAPLQISPQQAARDQGIVRQVHAAQTAGRQIVTQQRALRRANPAGNNPARNNPSRTNPARQQPAPPKPNNNAPNRRDGTNPPALQGQPAPQGQRKGAPGLQRPGQIRPPPGRPAAKRKPNEKR